MLSYSISETKKSNESDKVSEQTVDEKLNLWRRNQTVAQENLTKGITDQWHRLPNKFIVPTRHFDKYQRSIEYQSSDLKTESSQAAWEAKFQIIPNRTLESMSLTSEEGSGCDKIQNYHLAHGNTKTQIVWMPAIKVMKHFKKESDKVLIEWQLLNKTSNKKAVNDKFNQLLSYQTTDFADIGDNESDPFLQKMIKMGFIQHAHAIEENNETKTDHVH